MTCIVRNMIYERQPVVQKAFSHFFVYQGKKKDMLHKDTKWECLGSLLEFV